ncbi:Putative lipoprotein [Alloalcanivorax dieselolei B5]|uniref:Putative lipoprotein n=1 Tax=Alcanivorax dieselolei (strain DSM 16502 / CGMCC 1.3690 / MCCC 1A00001 / B-5) TaxID=930169 RepID=K0CJH4_ALCDB|nr:hypothetical protein [Alloalcanivorax dieselolei]AFT71887.1 Putative lipoprotein [Alloalcanivorax dieselolei B5]GGK01700.1 hypothetical protein GCM10007426_33440 [Alloalcanivorax dieselolei]
MFKRTFTFLFVTLFSITLAACGGGGGSSSGGDNGGGDNGGGDGDGGGDGGASTYHYEFLPGTQFTDTQIINMGAEGYVFLGPVILGSNVDEEGLLFGRYQETTYEYRINPQQPTLSQFETEANVQGQAGFALNAPYVNLYGDSTTQTVYMRQQGANTTYETKVTPGLATSADALIAAANDLGDEGYLLLGPIRDSSGNAGYLWQRAVNGTARYNYRSTPADFEETEEEFLTAISEQGNQGYLWLYPFAFVNTNGAEEFANFYIKDTTSQATFSYELTPSADTYAEVVADANAKGAEGIYFFGFVTFVSHDPVNDPTGERLLFVTAENCSGSPLCAFPTKVL